MSNAVVHSFTCSLIYSFIDVENSSIVHKIVFLTSSDHPEDDAKDEESQQAELNCCGEIDQRFCDTVTQVTCSVKKKIIKVEFLTFMISRGFS